MQSVVEEVLASANNGRLTCFHEDSTLDFKEEAGRRRGQDLEPGRPENPEAAVKLADEVACWANTPGGGVLIVGVEDKSGILLGTALDIDWLRHRIDEAVNVAPHIEERVVDGVRLLVIYVAESREPVATTGNRLVWRVGDQCKPVDRVEWWHHHRTRQGFDPMAGVSDAPLGAVCPGAMAFTRRLLQPETTATDADLLARVGVLHSSEYLTEAGKLLFTSSQRSWLQLTVIDVLGGNVTNSIYGEPGTSLLEQLELIERSIRALNMSSPVASGLGLTPIDQVPAKAVREALLNGIVHRDWLHNEPTEVQWFTLDATLCVRSPGGFSGGVTASTILNQRFARYPALADACRALGLVEKQGLGIDRMYQAMIVLGHRPPVIHQVAGPSVECTLAGGKPVLPIINLVAGLRPEPRQHDSRIAILLYTLLHEPFVTYETAAAALQTDTQTAERTILAARKPPSVGHRWLSLIRMSTASAKWL